MSGLRVGTWNVEYARGLEKNRRRLELLETEAAQVWVLTETHDDLGGRHYYGTKACRSLLNTELSRANLECLTTTNRFDADVLQHPPIDHVCAGPGQDRYFTTEVHGWNNVVDGARLSDHGGVLVAFSGLELPPLTPS